MVAKLGDTTSRPSEKRSRVQRACGHDVCGAAGSSCYPIRVTMTYHELQFGVQVFICRGTVFGSIKIPRSERSQEIDLMPTDFSLRFLHDF
jgi:hypothetical protein